MVLSVLVDEADVSRDPDNQKAFIEVVPEAQEVRRRLGQSLRETAILRQLLRVADRADKERRMCQEMVRAG